MTWIVSLDPINSGDTCKIELENNLNFITLEDIMFGDVWFCSGQSNMGWAMLGNYYLFCLEFNLNLLYLYIFFVNQALKIGLMRLKHPKTIQISGCSELDRVRLFCRRMTLFS